MKESKLRRLPIPRSWIIFLLGTILLFASSRIANAQTEEEIVPVPEWVAGLIIDELIVKDGLTYELSKKDSILTVYETGFKRDQDIIAMYKLNEQEYKAVIDNKDLVIESKIKETKQLKREIKGLKGLGLLLVIALLVSLFV